jgi:hypothetical protein
MILFLILYTMNYNLVEMKSYDGDYHDAQWHTVMVWIMIH